LRLRDGLERRAGIQDAQHVLDVVAHGLHRGAHLLRDLLGRKAGREHGERLALAQAQERRSLRERLAAVQHLDEPEAAEHLPVSISERDRVDRDAHAAAVGAAHRGLELGARGAVLLARVRVTSPREVARREHTRVQAAAQVTDELPRSCVLPAHATVVVDDVRRRPSRL